MKIVKLETLFQELKSGQNIFVHTAVCNPEILLDELVAVVKNKNLKNVSVYHLHLEGRAPHVDISLKNQITAKCFFVGSNCREAVQSGRASYIPVFLSEIGKLFTNNVIALDWALVQISPIDKHGYATLGPSVDISLTALHCAKKVVAQINPHMPRVLGDGVIHVNDIDYAVEMASDLKTIRIGDTTPEIKKIGSLVANLIEDGSCLQMGIGDIPNAVLSELKGHKNLGIHTEMFSDGVMELIKKGVVNNSLKKIHPYKVVSSFAMGSKDLYDFLDDNPVMQFMSSEFVNDPRVIQKNNNVCAINSALAIDLTGQICADSIGHKIYSGVGGQVDFLRGAALSQGGKAIIAMTAKTTKNISKIVSTFAPGSGVVSSRAHVRFVATEWGVCDLQGKTVSERAKLLINLADPAFRDELTSLAKKVNLI